MAFDGTDDRASSLQGLFDLLRGLRAPGGGDPDPAAQAQALFGAGQAPAGPAGLADLPAQPVFRLVDPSAAGPDVQPDPGPQVSGPQVLGPQVFEPQVAVVQRQAPWSDPGPFRPLPQLDPRTLQPAPAGLAPQQTYPPVPALGPALGPPPLGAGRLDLAQLPVDAQVGQIAVDGQGYRERYLGQNRNGARVWSGPDTTTTDPNAQTATDELVVSGRRQPHHWYDPLVAGVNAVERAALQVSPTGHILQMLRTAADLASGTGASGAPPQSSPPIPGLGALVPQLRPARADPGDHAAVTPRTGVGAPGSVGAPPAQGAVVQLSPSDVMNLKKTLQTEWVPSAGDEQAYGVIDTILNRKASGHFGATVADIVNQRKQFTDINGPVSWTPKDHIGIGPHDSVEQIPDSWVRPRVSQVVDAYLADRANGRPSSVGANLNYANPYGSTPNNMAWINNLDGPVFGTGRAIHRHGTTPENRKYMPQPYVIQILK